MVLRNVTFRRFCLSCNNPQTICNIEWYVLWYLIVLRKFRIALLVPAMVHFVSFGPWSAKFGRTVEFYPAQVIVCNLYRVSRRVCHELANSASTSIFRSVFLKLIWPADPFSGKRILSAPPKKSIFAFITHRCNETFKLKFFKQFIKSTVVRFSLQTKKYNNE